MEEIENLLSAPLPGNPDSKVSDLFCAHFGVKEEGNVDPYQVQTQLFYYHLK